MRKVGILFVLMVSMLTAAQSQADMIKYTDKNGTLCFVDDLSKVPKKYRKNVIREARENDPPQAAAQSESPQENRSGGDVVHICYHPVRTHINGSIYGRDLTDFLDARGYQYVVHMATDLAAAKECFELYCKGNAKCLSQAERKYSPKSHDTDPLPFLAVGNKILRRESNIPDTLDKHFHVDPKTPIKWKD